MSAADDFSRAKILTPNEPATPVKRRGVVLVVDDEDGVRMGVKIALKDDYDLLFAQDGQQALELAAQQEFDVAILDIRMPGISGIEVLRKLRGTHPDVEVIMFTAFETTETMREALRLRAFDYINKPFDLATIRKAVAQAMQRRLIQSNSRSNADKIQELLVELQNEKINAQDARTHKDIYASILHDINGPLTVVSGFVQLLNKRVGENDQLQPADLEFVKERLKLIERQVTNCIEIQRRYLGFLRRQTADHANTEVNQLLKDLDQLLRVHPTRQENEFTVQQLPAEVVIKLNGTDVIQMLLNLAVNGFQCTSVPHNVEVGGEVLPAALDLAQFKDGPKDRFLNIESMANTPPLLKLWVRDDGPGIPEDVLPNIFQSYFTTKGQGKGTGLGLSIVQRLVKDAHGALHVHTERGVGTTFTIYLPGIQLAK